MATVQISSNNYSGQTANITFYPCSGGTLLLGTQVIPYTYSSDYYYGQYSLYFSAYNSTCTYDIVCPSPTPTVTSTPTNTNTPTVTPTANIVTSGLVIQLDAYNSSSYPGTGTTVYDLTNTYNHTLTTAPYTVLNGIKCFDCNGDVNTNIRVNGAGQILPS